MSQYRDVLSDLHPRHQFHAHCHPCGRFFEVPVTALIERLGPDTPTTVAMQKITCAQCGGRASVNRGYPKEDGEGYFLRPNPLDKRP